MNFRVRKIYWYMLLFSICTSVLIGGTRYTDMCKLNEVRAAKSETALTDVFKPYMQAGLFDIPLKDIADKIICDKKVLKVELDYNFPDAIRLRCNNTETIAVVMVDRGREFFRLDARCCLLPGEFPASDVTLPLITGLIGIHPYRVSHDACLRQLTEQLEMVRDDFIDFYQALDNIHIESQDKIRLYINGLSFGVITYPGALYRTIKRLKLFLLEYNPDLEGIKNLDMRSDDLIIAAGRKNG